MPGKKRDGNRYQNLWCFHCNSRQTHRVTISNEDYGDHEASEWIYLPYRFLKAGLRVWRRKYKCQKCFKGEFNCPYTYTVQDHLLNRVLNKVVELDTENKRLKAELEAVKQRLLGLATEIEKGEILKPVEGVKT